MARPYTENRKKSNQQWDSANLDRISIALPKGTKALISDRCKETGESMNAFFKRLIQSELNGNSPAVPVVQERPKVGDDIPEA